MSFCYSRGCMPQSSRALCGLLVWQVEVQIHIRWYCEIYMYLKLQEYRWLQPSQMHQRWMETRSIMSRYFEVNFVLWHCVTVLCLLLKVWKELLVHYQKVPGMKSVTKKIVFQLGETRCNFNYSVFGFHLNKSPSPRNQWPRNCQGRICCAEILCFVEHKPCSC